jgi:signal transduction histidine kinase
MVPDASKRLGEPPDGDAGGILNLAAYTTIAIGYLLAVLTSHHLTLGPFLLFTLINLAWAATFLHYGPEDHRTQTTTLHLGAMTLLAAAALFCLPLGLGYDWLLPTLTTAVVALICRWRLTLVVVAILIVASSAAVALADGNWTAIALMLVQTTPAYFFAMTFSLVLRRQYVLRERAEDLALEVSRSHAELERAHSELRARASQAEELTVSRERNRMAREIHDTLGHYLTVLAVQLETALKLEERDDSRLHAELLEARRVTGECLAEVRRSVAALRPADLTAMALPEALRRLVAETEALLPETEITLDVDSPIETLPPELHLALYRCAQEALTNIRKHATASKVLLCLREDARAPDSGDGERTVELIVLDNGDGCKAGPQDEEASPAPSMGHAANGEQGFGLLGMRERIALLGGTVHAGAEPGKGWRVAMRVPVGACAGSHTAAAAPAPTVSSAVSPAASSDTSTASEVAVSQGAEE